MPVVSVSSLIQASIVHERLAAAKRPDCGTLMPAASTLARLRARGVVPGLLIEYSGSQGSSSSPSS